uniref:YtxH domain-containing protein n=1 Tax=Heterorhabditis bacteriophora TaxID=37862 RepID=A0A1I7WVS4_HETBA
MGLFSNLLALCIGAYGGAFLAQNYEIGKVPSITELSKQMEEYMKQFKKDD